MKFKKPKKPLPDREYETLLKFLEEFGIVLECYSPLEIGTADGASRATGEFAEIIIGLLSVKKAKQAAAKHHCHWPGCVEEVPPKLWGCKKHWFTLPKALRDEVWAAYVPGQEVTKTPSKRYLKVARKVQDWIKQNYPEG